MADNVSSDERLSQINEDLSKILEEKIEFLTRTLGETQRFTQKIASTELDIQRNTTQHARLSAQSQALDADLAQLGEKVVAAGAERDKKQAEKNTREKEIQRIEFEIENARKANAESESRIRELEKEQIALEKENSQLKNRVSLLEQAAAELRQLREKLRSRIADLDSETTGSAGGGE